MKIRKVFAAPLVLTATLAHADDKVRFDGYQCYSGPPETESSVPCPTKVLPKAKKGQPVWQEAGGGACRTTDLKQVRCPPNLILADPPYVRNGDVTISYDEGAFACRQMEDMQCPQGATCNPPPPQPYACPENVTQYPVVIVSDGTMCQTERAPMHCPPHVACNPPPPKVVPCPK